ncbi:MAG TPA: hypothetical protein PLN19_07570 [Methanothrix sp.]|jgi:hypothetical protein|nr:hypothetical protein [Methanothrix sp.]HOV81680.1 hypothetical protein [Methanothrix sp.]HPC89184.1 hypothetical protein [Methanothrix sp.]HQE88113.1 hypothetical protein [Methanothrix sp.]HQI67779.1 hypothetical protein [Methanothrix sp.]
MKIRFICKNCGSVNEKEKDVLTDPDYSQEDWLCDLPMGFEWILPVGKITPVVGSPLYVSSLGGNFTREEYLDRYFIDPEIAYQLMRQDKENSISQAIEPQKVQSLIRGRKT